MAEQAEAESTLLDLLADWEESRAAGRVVSPDEICAARPDLLDHFRRQAERLAAADRLLALAGVGADDSPPDIPGFELGERIGHGGMGVVYRGRDRILDRVVAVKLPAGSYCGPDARRQFEREGRTLAQLRHPNIVPIHSAGVSGFTPYLVMDYIPGGHLGAWAAVPRPPDSVAEVVEQVCRAIDHAHRAGIVHRDLKPSNVLIDGQGRPMVSDFGVAALLKGGSSAPDAANTSADTRAVATTQARGTPAYAAPEQLQSGRGGVTPAVDIWSLGVILHELLTGRRPELGDEAAERTSAPTGLLQIARKCREPSPADRYPSAAAVADAIRAWRTARRRRVRRIAAVTLIIAATLLAAGLVWFSPDARQRRQTAAAVRKLEREGQLDLLAAGPGGKALAVKRYRGAATDFSQTEAGFRLETATDASLIQLLPSVPAEAYTLRATVRPNSFGNGRLVFGVVCKLAAFTNENGDQNAVHGLFVSLNSDRKSAIASFEPRWYGEGPGPGDTLIRALSHKARPDRQHKYAPTPNPGEDKWDIIVRVTPANVTASCTRLDSGEAAGFGSLTTADREDFLRNVLRQYPDATPFEERATNGSGVGLFVAFGSITVQHYTVALDVPQ